MDLIGHELSNILKLSLQNRGCSCVQTNEEIFEQIQAYSRYFKSIFREYVQYVQRLKDNCTCPSVQPILLHVQYDKLDWYNRI